MIAYCFNKKISYHNVFGSDIFTTETVITVLLPHTYFFYGAENYIPLVNNFNW